MYRIRIHNLQNRIGSGLKKIRVETPLQPASACWIRCLCLLDAFIRFFVFLFIMLIWCPTVVSQHLSKNDKRDWLTRWPLRSFANPIWHSPPLCLHWSTMVPLCFHLLYCSLTIGLLYAMSFMMLLLVGWVIWNNKPLTIDHWIGYGWKNARSSSSVRQ